MNLENVADVYPLTPIQQGMLFHSISGDGEHSAAYLDQVVFTVEGNLEFDRFSEAVQFVFSRYDALKTAFVWDGVDEPLQVVREQVKFDVCRHDWSQQASDQQNQRLEKLVQKELAQGFVIEQAPLIRLNTIQVSDNQWKLLLVFHHAILDGWSAGLLIQNLLRHYDGTELLDAEVFRFRDYVAWHAAQNPDDALKFWEQELAGFDQKNPLRCFETEELESEQLGFAQRSLALNSQQSDNLNQFARAQRVTLNTLMVAAWSLTVGRYSGGKQDVVFGRTVAGRPAELRNIHSAIGNFVNTLPFRTKLDPERTLADWLQEIQSKQNQCLELEFASLASIQKRSDVLPGESLFDSILVFENYPGHESSSGSLQIADVQHFEKSNYPLAFLIVPGTSGIELLIVFDKQVYTSDVVDRLLEFVQFKLQELSSSPHQRLSKLLTTLPDSDSDFLRKQLSFTQIDDGGQSVVKRFRETARKNPEAIAVACDGQFLSYRQLDEKSNQIAHAIRRNGVESNAAIGLLVDRSLEMLIGIFGILKAGCFYIPLDTVYPREHVEFVLRDAKVQLVLTKTEFAVRVPEPHSQCILTFEDVETELNNDIDLTRQDQLAYAIYTSGSTGNPKGVMIDHRNLIQSTLARSEYYQQDPSSYLLLSSFAFDSSVAGIFWTLCNGGKLVLPIDGGEKDAHGLCLLIQNQSVTHLLCLPILYRVILENGAFDQLQTLQVAIVAGDAISGDVVVAHELMVNSTAWTCSLFNEYGPTENTVWSTVHRVGLQERENIPIGKSIASTGIALLDDAMRPVPVGVPGEIVLTGSGVSRGYLGGEASKSKKFISDFDCLGASMRVYMTGDVGCFKQDGSLWFLGRKDRQVKIRGYRVELAEIESVLANVPGVTEVAVVVQRVGQARSFPRLLLRWRTARRRRTMEDTSPGPSRRFHDTGRV